MSPQQVREGWDVRFSQLSSAVVEVAIMRVDQRTDASREGVPGHLTGESLWGEGLEECQQRQL